MRSAMLVCGILLAAASPSRADDKAELDALIDRAIKAVGGAEELKKHSTVAWTENCTTRESVEPAGKVGVVDHRWAAQWPDRGCLGFGIGGLFMNGNDAWYAGQGGMWTPPKESQAWLTQHLYHNWLFMQLPLKDERFTLKRVIEIKVHGQPALGVRISTKGREDVTLYFDKESALTAKLETSVMDPRSNKPVSLEWFFYDHKEQDGLKLPTRSSMMLNGMPFTDIQIANYRRRDKLPEQLFDKTNKGP